MIEANKYRIRGGSMATDDSFGNNGSFKIPVSGRTILQAIASYGMGWEHVSVVAYSDGKARTPTWAEMCVVKNVFWSEDECVIQYHPPKTEYVNNHEHCLHLWKPIGIEIPLPDSLMVGIK